MNKKELMYQKIKEHGSELNAIFGLNEHPVDLCKKLRRIELKANNLALEYCNGTITETVMELKAERLMDNLSKILNKNGSIVPVHFNRDPRGYALKIDDEYMRENNIKLYHDWGGYGIIAPDFSQE